MLAVDEAIKRILAGVVPVPAETVALPQALGRVLALDVTARVSHPPADVSAMDGYAVRGADVATAPVVLTRIGTVHAGQVFGGTVGPGEAVRIFTGAALPAGTDAIIIQENTETDSDGVTVRQTVDPGHFVRPAGQDFRAGAVGLSAPRLLTARDLALAAAMNVPWLSVRRRPVVALLSTGDELVLPGEVPGPGQIIGCNGIGLAALVEALGGTALSLGMARDRRADTVARLAEAEGADILVTTGGAAEGEHDLVRAALAELGWQSDFWKIAMRPGKPLFFGHLGRTRVLGLPGNPVSALVCAVLFLHPLLRALQGLPPEDAVLHGQARLTMPMPANKDRQDYVRATFGTDEAGRPTATPMAQQDSAMISRLAAADGFIVRPPQAPAVAAGESVMIRRLPTPLI